ncbi:hypothetical protein Pan216_20670 [Planctomycetes bacterium Pan216]|uniref:Uncharacterized protein n=1 Tax=Kolteria novifilia TaxID=2527975 RepID=A0A518B2J7_9BACT|nr:hypothetical protein Pan216_20670 [Planctomycetes bacterium Pan216]
MKKQRIGLIELLARIVVDIDEEGNLSLGTTTHTNEDLGADAVGRALAILYSDTWHWSQRSIAEIAKAAGCDRSTLSSNQRFRRAYQASMRAHEVPPRRGFKMDDGRMEAIDDRSDDEEF